MNRLRQLDGLRGCAILLVLVWHYFVCQIKVRPDTFLSTSKLWLSFTWSGVDLFFVLSGFLITGILIDNANATNYFRTFYIRRACRILPIYFVMLLLFITAVWAFRQQADRFPWLLKDTIPAWAHATFTQNIFMALTEKWGAAYALGPTWSLAVEEQFYLVLPLIVFFMPRRTLPVLLVALIILAPMLRATTASTMQRYVLAPWRADALMTGALLAWCVRQPAILQFFVAQRRSFYLIFGGLVVSTVLIGGRGARPGGPVDHLVFAATYGVLLVLAYVDAEGFLARVLRCRFLVWFGTLSYGIYLLHQPVSATLHAWWAGRRPAIFTLEDALLSCLALGLTLLLAALSFRLFERRFTEFGHKFRYRTEPREVPVLAPAMQPMGK